MMRILITIFTCFILQIAALSAQAGMTIMFDSPCLGQFTMTYSGTDATGRHFYGDEGFNGPGNPVFSIFWDQASGSWLVGLLGTGSDNNILYATAPNSFSPNPPDSATEPYLATTAGGCGAVPGGGTAMVSGSGTQTTAGTPCAMAGDDDNDGICNDNDVCPGADDTLDGDGDNIPDCNDPNPGVFDGVSFNSPCLGGELVFTLSGNDGTRNTYALASQGLEIIFNATDNRWEMRGSSAGGAVIYFNTLASIPDPPSTVAMAWEGVPANGCADVPTVGGTGTQDMRCLTLVADCPDDGDACTTAILDADCNCTNVPVDNVAPVPVCNQTVTVELDIDGNGILDPADVDNNSSDDACGSITGLSLDRTDFDCDDIALSPITVTLTVTDNEGAMETCTSAITVEDNLAPTFTCTDITVDLNATGEYFITNDDVFFRMIQNWNDNCAPAPTSFGSGNRTITCDNTTNGTFSYFFGARDGNGQEALCTSIVTVNDPTLFCDDAPVAMCQDFQTFIATGETTYTVNASDFDNGSTDDNGIAGFVFSDQISTIESTGLGGNFNAEGFGQTFTAEQSGFIQTIRLKFGAASSDRTIHIYNGGSGSGVPGIGSPDYSQSGIELLDGTGGMFTEIRLTTPFPVIEGASYSFVVEGFSSALYGFADTYQDGQFLFNYNLNNQDEIDLAFEVDFLGSSTQEFMEGIHPVTIFVVDDAGQLSAGCDATFTLDAACTPGTFTETPTPAVDGYCSQENVTLTALATLNDSEDIFWYTGDCANPGVQIGQGTSFSFQFPADGQDMTIVCVIQGPDGCGDGACVTTTLLHETVPPTLFTLDITKELDGDGNATLLPDEVFDVANSFDDCVNGSRSMANGLTATSVTPNAFTAANVGPNTVTLTATDESGNTTTETAVVTIIEAALPVEWLFFGANTGAKKVDLQWKTSHEPDNAGFHIERSPDGRAWSVLAEQAPLASNAYGYTDATPLTGDNYYRIRQTDFDGTVTYSPVEVVTFTGSLTGLLVAPNPATDVFTVRIPASFGEGAQLELIDITGRAVRMNPNPTEDGIRFNAAQLARGVYLLRALSQDGKVTETVRVVLH